MYVYILIYFFSIISGFFVNQKKEIHKKIYLIINFTILTVIAGFRSWNVGSDTIAYVRLFNFINDNIVTSETERMENGFKILCRFVGRFQDNPQILLVIFSVIISTCVSYIIYVYSKEISFSVPIFISMFFLNSLNISRQYVGVSLALIAIHFILKHKYKTALIFTLCAFGIHRISILLVFSWMVCTYISVKTACLVAILAIVFGGSLLQFLSFLIVRINLSYVTYLRGAYINYNEGIGLITIFIMLLLFMYAYLEYFEIRESQFQICIKHSKKEIEEVCFLILTMSVLSGILLRQYALGSRISEELNIFLIIFISNMNIRGNWRRLYKFLILCICFLFMINVCLAGGIGVEEYSFCF